ncbi:hypothetical protein [Paraburkholderia sp. BCC1886]|uniref:hypothetical protein n=1 Tax=Paraburkholderia sp. BCC1886 TaxID=2562670 RepID=UPI0011831005|nr:hypothetical protein [Paraburkholderia sp. BCC1886]
MDDITYTKGTYTATASIKEVKADTWQGLVTLSRNDEDGDDSGSGESTDYHVEATTSTPEEALEEAKALAHRILGDINV